jgi:RHS repeat-associated protein
MSLKGILSNIYMRYPLGIDINRKLTSITESSADATEGYYKAQAGAYNYTQDGSMKYDANKNLTLTYNPLGLIAKANTNGAINDYLYTASGQKLSMSSGGTTYSYRGGIVYASTNTTDQIEQIATAEGRWLPKEALSSFKPDGTKSVAAKYGRYEFMMKDHLGNNRLAFRCIEIENATAITQAYPAIVTAEYQYDAWGLSIENQMMASSFTAQFGKFAATNRYKYNDKEYISDSKLYDYGARHYDPVVGRWWAVDPLAEKNHFESSYVFVHNNSVMYVDPDGRDGIRVIDDKNRMITVRAVYYVQTEKSTYFKENGKTRTLDGYSAKDVASMQGNYNKYLNEAGLSVSDGEYKGYSIKFDLQFKEGGTIESSKESAKNTSENGFSVGNSLSVGNENTYSRFKTKEITNSDGTVSTSTVGGITLDHKEILMNKNEDTKMNRVHEIFHTLGFDHPKGTGGNNGIMRYPPEKPNQNDANQIGNSTFLPKVKANE